MKTETYLDHKGYLRDVSTNQLIHRMEFEPLPQDWIVHHIDGNKLNNDLENLLPMHETTHRYLHEEMFVNGRNKRRRGTVEAVERIEKKGTWIPVDIRGKWPLNIRELVRIKAIRKEERREKDRKTQQKRWGNFSKKSKAKIIIRQPQPKT